MQFGIRELLFFALMIGLVVASVFALQKRRTQTDALRADTQQKRKQLVDLKQSTSGNEDWNQKFAELKQAISFFESKLPQEREIDKILKEVWQMAEANSLQTRTVKTLRSERGASYSEQPIEMSLAGDFNGFYVFLQQLENMPRITRVTNMSLTKMADRDGAMQAKMTLSIFFEPDAGGSKMAASR
ncbi:MAG TPA: type 4a pilus biogenesis protein PilO [Tepidisphaeraceae bacterium]|jgi:type IV pilus assembly protein PilO